MQRRLLHLSLFAAYCLAGISGARADQSGDALPLGTLEVSGMAEGFAGDDMTSPGLAAVAGGEVSGQLLLSAQRLNRDQSVDLGGATRVSQRIEPLLAATPGQALDLLKGLMNSPAAALFAIAIISIAALSRRNTSLLGDDEVGEDR